MEGKGLTRCVPVLGCEFVVVGAQGVSQHRSVGPELAWPRLGQAGELAAGAAHLPSATGLGVSVKLISWSLKFFQTGPPSRELARPSLPSCPRRLPLPNWLLRSKGPFCSVTCS